MFVQSHHVGRSMQHAVCEAGDEVHFRIFVDRTKAGAVLGGRVVVAPGHWPVDSLPRGNCV